MAQPGVQAEGVEFRTGMVSFHLHVFEAVLQNVREDFETEGYDENALAEFRQAWELKLMQAGAFHDREAGSPHSLESDALQSDRLQFLFPQESMTSQTGARENTGGRKKTGGRDNTSGSGPVERNYHWESFGKPAAFMKPPAPWMNRKLQDVVVDVELNLTDDGARRENGDARTAVMEESGALATGKRKRENSGSRSHSSADNIAQLDGAGDFSSIFQEVAEEDYNDFGHEDADENQESRGEDQTTDNVSDTKVDGGDITLDDEEPPLNEDDDDGEEEDVDELDDIDPGDECNNFILAKFEKVSKTKKNQAWKCIFTDGIMNLNTKEYVFNKGMGEFDF